MIGCWKCGFAKLRSTCDNFLAKVTKPLSVLQSCSLRLLSISSCAVMAKSTIFSSLQLLWLAVVDSRALVVHDGDFSCCYQKHPTYPLIFAAEIVERSILVKSRKPVQLLSSSYVSADAKRLGEQAKCCLDWPWTARSFWICLHAGADRP